MRWQQRFFGMSPPVCLLLGLTVAVLPVDAQEPEGPPLTIRTMDQDVRLAEVRLSPARAELVVISDRSGDSKLWRLSSAGTDPLLLVADGGIETAPEWSPDGSRIAFLRPAVEGTEIWSVSREGRDLERLAVDSSGARFLTWSPDGSRIAFVSARHGHQDIWLLDVASGRLERLTEAINPFDEIRWRPAWSPDGRWIAHVSNRAGEFDDDLWLVEVATGKVEKVTSDVQVVGNPIWSPNGRYVAFNTVPRDGLWYHEMSDIRVLEMPGQSVRLLEMEVFVSDRFSGYRMAWSPDSRSIYFRYEWEGDANLWRVDVENDLATKMTYEQGRFGEFSVSGNGERIAYIRSTPIRAGEVHLFETAGGPVRRITHWTTAFEGIDPPQKVAYRSMDGKYILGYVFLPPRFDPEGSHPALVQVHGGGNNAYGNGFHPLEHALSAEGFVVLAIEYRGSAGHGRAFQDLSWGEFGAEQGWDAVAAAHYLRAQPWSNGRVGIYGGSYGGVMTMAGVTRDSEPFDAAAPFYGIYDWEAAFDNADRLARLMILKGHRNHTPAEAPDLYRHTASLRQLDIVDSGLPFLVIHGELDRRAPFDQSERLVDALRARGNDVEFHSYPDEAHGFRHPENRLDAYGRLVDFFHKHLGNSGKEFVP